MMDKIRGLFRWAAISDITKSALPMTGAAAGTQTPAQDVEVVQGFGFKAVPKPADGTGEPLALLAGTGADAVALAVVDFRFEPTDITDGNACMYNATGQRLDLKSAGVVANCACDATGYKASGTAGKNGTLTITIGAPPVGVATVTVTGGIITGVTGSGDCVWAGD